jgi:hypothetical protein
MSKLAFEKLCFYPACRICNKKTIKIEGKKGHQCPKCQSKDTTTPPKMAYFVKVRIEAKTYTIFESAFEKMNILPEEKALKTFFSDGLFEITLKNVTFGSKSIAKPN